MTAATRQPQPEPTLDLAATMAAIGRRAREAAAGAGAGLARQRKAAALRAAAAAVRAAGRTRSSPPTPTTSPRRAGRHRAPRCSTGWRSTRSGSRRWRSGSRTSPPCPIRSARVLADWTRPNGLDIPRVRVPLGVIGIIYESRPNVTADAGGARASSPAMPRSCAAARRASTPRARCSRRCATGSQRPACRDDAVQLVPTRDRAAVGADADAERRSST